MRFFICVVVNLLIKRYLYINVSAVEITALSVGMLLCIIRDLRGIVSGFKPGPRL